MRALLIAAFVCCLAAALAHAAVIGKATVTAEQAPVMSGKQVIATAKKGDTFDVTEEKGDWFGVAPSQGWIHKGNVRYEAGTPPAGGSLAGPVWARIILDEEFFPKGSTWIAAESAYAALQQFGIPGPPSPGIANILGMTAGMSEARLTPASLTARYGPGRTEPSPGGKDFGVTYHMYGPLGFGIAPGEKGYSWLKAEERLFKAGFVKAARDALAAAGADPQADAASWKARIKAVPDVFLAPYLEASRMLKAKGAHATFTYSPNPDLPNWDVAFPAPPPEEVLKLIEDRLKGRMFRAVSGLYVFCNKSKTQPDISAEEASAIWNQAAKKAFGEK
jgi:hypothetical protein